jgi:hypothetical protein
MNPCGNDKCNEINAGIDACIQSLVDALNNSGFTTVASCCGHGKTNGNIALKDGRELIIAPDYATAREIERHFPDIHGEASSRSPALLSAERRFFVEVDSLLSYMVYNNYGLTMHDHDRDFRELMEKLYKEARALYGSR